MKIIRDLDMLHPILADCVKKIQSNVIAKYNIPMGLFETGRTHERHEMLIQKGKTRDIVSRHLFDIENDPPHYATAVDYVYYDQKWSWNLRDGSVTAWYILFGNLVLDACHELNWGGTERKSTNYCHFQLKDSILNYYLDKYPCVSP